MKSEAFKCFSGCECEFDRNQPNNDTTQGTYPCGQYNCWYQIIEDGEENEY